ncbi:bifunctional methionine sulfoxide reductase B/A protein [Shewanella salipaludis]|uniref:Peptide methionine sulfoxide reductase MsrA n=1 Tax=Shewanella salipaludis TaxID=2723052 RepID=A0A972JH78_9GAMM|nr:bifunctional methionine sulfoxide reductase B/A protein [Shewanella salipaludis]NMH63713.1 bifunctional methionine sulfoxide reductase B/A protein [Shewanella salipaludis]
MRELTDFEKYVIEEKGTERPFSGEYVTLDAPGLYLCKKCGAPLYRSDSKFNAHCGWPAFDDEIPGAVTRHPDPDGSRTEIVCSRCQGHLGHVFEGEFLTPKNVRHCVNSVSLLFQPQDAEQPRSNERLATLGGGCFWCLEAIFAALKGVKGVRSGYAGGLAEEADYRTVCSGSTGHAEVVQITYDPAEISFGTLLQVFFQSHDPTTLNRQGNDIGPQYRSVIFAHDSEQIDSASAMIEKLGQAGLWAGPIVTELTGYQAFYPAENYHNDYFALHGEQPYCQLVVRPKVEKFRAAFAALLKQES